MESIKSKVYFTKEISPEKVVEMFKVLNKELPGKVAIKVHSGEKGNKNFLKPAFFKPIVDLLDATLVECNTAYPGARDTTEKHKKLLKDHGWLKLFPDKFVIMDGEGDTEIQFPEGKIIKKLPVGKAIKNFQSSLVISHFKGHIMGGFGGAMKNLSIGFASKKGKSLQHNGGNTGPSKATPKQFQQCMADAASAVVKYFNGNMAFINVLANISADCDCTSAAAPPCIPDLGIMSSTDPVALDKACLDMIYNLKDKKKTELTKRIEKKEGIFGNTCFSQLGSGSLDYELINLDGATDKSKEEEKKS